MHIPLSVGLIGKGGKALPLALSGENAQGAEERVLELREARQRFVFTGIDEEPVLSLARNFSAPVILKADTDATTRAFLMERDSDAFNRWEAGQQLAIDGAQLHAGEVDAQAGVPALAGLSQPVASHRAGV